MVKYADGWGPVTAVLMYSGTNSYFSKRIYESSFRLQKQPRMEILKSMAFLSPIYDQPLPDELLIVSSLAVEIGSTVQKGSW